MGICHASRYIMEEAAVRMDTLAAVIPLQCWTWPTAISCKSKTMGQNQPRLLSAYHHSNCTRFHLLNGCNYSLQSGRYNWRHDQTLKTITSGLMPFIAQANEREYYTQDTGYIPTIAFRTADGTAHRNSAKPHPKKQCTNILYTKKPMTGKFSWMKNTSK